MGSILLSGSPSSRRYPTDRLTASRRLGDRRHRFCNARIPCAPITPFCETQAVAKRDDCGMVDWGAGDYEATAEELAPVAEAVVQRARISAGEDVLDVACGTGNAALLAAARGARVVGVDGAPRLLEVARERARARGVVVDFREGDLLALPVDDGAVDVALSVFGVIFAADAARALRELARVLRPSGRALVTAWIPEGPIDAMLTAMSRVVGRITSSAPPKRFPWFDGDAVASLAAEAGLAFGATSRAELPIRAASPEAYFAAGQNHPMALAVRPVIERAGAGAEVRDAAMSVLREANEDPDGFLVHSPYVVHQLLPG
jgi:SAM-dependent methyltransferase